MFTSKLFTNFQLSCIAAMSLVASLAQVTFSPANATPCSSITSDTQLDSGTCTIGAQTYGITLYQVGVCTADPIPTSSSSPDTSSCQMILNNPSGQYMDLGQLNPTPLSFTALRPSDGTYNYLYARFGKTVTIKGSANLPSGNWYTTANSYSGNGSLGSQAIGNLAAYPNTLNSFAGSCGERNTIGGGGVLVTSSLQATSYNGVSCPGAEFVAVSASTILMLGSTLTINNNTSGIDMRFTTSSDAIGLYRMPSGSGYDYIFGFLGFRLSLRLL